MRASIVGRAALVVILFVATACSGDEGAGAGGAGASPAGTPPVASETPLETAPEASDPESPAGEADGAGAVGGAAEQTMQLADQAIGLGAASCNLPDQPDGPFRITADAADGKGSLVVVGVGGLGSATIEYKGVAYRSPGLNPSIEGAVVTFSGQAAAGSAAADAVDFSFHVVCP